MEWIARALRDNPSKSKSGLAAAMGRKPSAVTDLLNGRRRLRADEISVVAAYLEVDPPSFSDTRASRQVPLVGYVAAGAEAVLFGEGHGEADMVDAPDGSTENTVAVEVRGASLGPIFDLWLVFYDQVYDPPHDGLAGRLCVVGLADGRILVKKLQRSREPGFWHLLSNAEAPILDQIIEWAAPVRAMTPRG